MAGRFGIVEGMETMQQWCAGCASMREFVVVPDSEPAEFACTGCDAALVSPSGQPADTRTAVLV